MKNIFLSLTTLFTLAASACAHGPTMVEDVDELDSIESMLLMVDDTEVPIPTVTVNYMGDSTRIRRGVNTRGKPSFRVVIHRLNRYIQNHPLSDERMHARVEAGLTRAQENLAKMRAIRENCRTAGVAVEQCMREVRPIVRDTRRLLHRIVMAVRSDRRKTRDR